LPQAKNESVVIVGGGYVGGAAAYYLAREGHSVTLVEREHPGWGASGRNAGYLSMITRSAGAQLDLAWAGRRLYDELSTEIDNFEFRPSGTLTYYFEDQASFVEGFAARRREDGLSVTVISGDDARELCPILPDDIVGGVHSLNDGYIHPEKLATALATAAQREGARVVKADALSIDVSGGRCHGVRTSEGTIAADVTVITAGPWSPELLKAQGIPLEIVGLRSQLAQTTPVPYKFDVALFGPTFFTEYTFVRDLPGYDDDLILHPLQRVMPQVGTLELFAQREDGSLVIGCPMELVPGDKPTIAGMAITFGILGDHVPALQDVEVQKIWAGIIPQTGDGVPVLDEVAGTEGLWVGAGHAYGAMTGPVSGKLLADRIMGNPIEIDMTPFRYDRQAITEGLGRTVTL
jgi:glycine/D-amino acid oxidase-like deaminating enzyme